MFFLLTFDHLMAPSSKVEKVLLVRYYNQQVLSHIYKKETWLKGIIVDCFILIFSNRPSLSSHSWTKTFYICLNVGQKREKMWPTRNFLAKGKVFTKATLVDCSDSNNNNKKKRGLKKKKKNNY